MNPNQLFTELAVATLNHKDSGISDNIMAHNALINRLKNKNSIRNLSGGLRIDQNLEYTENSTYQRYSGADILDVSPSEVFTMAEYGWKQAVVHVTFTGEQRRINSDSKTRIIDFVKSKVKNAKTTALNNMNRDLYSAGTGLDQIGGLQQIIADVPTNTVGGISGADWAFWRNKVMKFSNGFGAGGAIIPSKDTIRQGMNKMYIALTRGAEKPDFILASPDFYEYYLESLQAMQQISRADTAKAGFTSLAYQDSDVFFDHTSEEIGNETVTIMPPSRMYFINTDYLYLAQHSDAKWTASEEKVSFNQDVMTIPMYWMGNLTCSNRKLQGLLAS